MQNICEDLATLLSNVHNSFDKKYITKNTNQTKLLAKSFASLLSKNDIIVLNGELGAGKTVFMSGIASYFDIEDEVSSPTFTIVNEYSLKDNSKIFHFDVYRIYDSNEFLERIGTEYFDEGISIIEWGNIIKDILPKRTIYIDISKDEKDINTRIIRIWRDVK